MFNFLFLLTVTATAAYARLNHADLARRQTASHVTTCGYNNGDANNPRTAGPGDDCTIDTPLGLWGFCPNTVVAAVDCGLAGFCIDSASCSTGCGPFPSSTGITTFTCNSNNFCSAVLLTAGADQTYTYLACGATAKTDHLLAIPITTIAATTSSASVTSASSINSSPTHSNPAAPGSSINNSPTHSTPAAPGSSSAAKPNSTGTIVGGVLGGMALICLTVLGLALLKRQRAHQANIAAAYPFTDNPESSGISKPHWDSSHNGVHELSSEREAGHSPIELHDRRNTVSAVTELS